MSIEAKTLLNGYQYEELIGEEADKFKKLWSMYTDGIIKFKSRDGIMPISFLKVADNFYNFKWRPTDIFLTSFPKSGTTWTQEIIWNLINNPDLNNPAANLIIGDRFTDFEEDTFRTITEASVEGKLMELFKLYCPDKDWRDGLLLQLWAELPLPRLLKAHLSLDFFQSNITEICKIFYIVRDPRDVICSMYHYSRLHLNWSFKGDLDEFIDEFINDKIVWGPYWTNVQNAWEKRDDPNMCIVFYEDLKEDPFKEVKKIDKFLNTNRTDQQMENIVKFTSFDEMKERMKDNPPTNKGKNFNQKIAENEGGFFRKGKVGDWKNTFTEEQAKKINEWMTHNLKSFGEDFKYKV